MGRDSYILVALQENKARWQVALRRMERQHMVGRSRKAMVLGICTGEWDGVTKRPGASNQEGRAGGPRSGKDRGAVPSEGRETDCPAFLLLVRIPVSFGTRVRSSDLA